MIANIKRWVIDPRWVPEITLDQMIVEMVANDLDKAKQHALLSKHGFSVAVGKE